jgi:glycosyltransferase involved in cell wall biosynthesis
MMSKSDKKKLGVIIPAFKEQFLKEALDSILNQTNEEFDLYIFNDASPYPLDDILAEYNGFFYHSFEENMGGTNLIAHWQRCLEFVDNEFIWIFSDDDVIREDGVEKFYQSLHKYGGDLFQFQIEMIDSYNNKIKNELPSPIFETSYSFLINRLQKKRRSCLPDHIFRSSAFKKYANSTIPNFPFAWNSDDANWLLIGQEKGIRLIEDSCIYIRNSGINISSKTGHDMEKIIADYQFMDWIKSQKFLWTKEVESILKKWMQKRIRIDYSISPKNYFSFWKDPTFKNRDLFEKYLIIRYPVFRYIWNVIK